jgi:hypothetical protein
MVALREIAPELWVAESPLRLAVQMGRRMTVARLASGGLWLHSPAELTPTLREELASLGAVRFVVPASKLHGHLSMGDYAAAYPDAELFAAPGLRDKRRDLDFAGELGEDPDGRWSHDIDQTLFRGSRQHDEVVFLHRASRTLIVGDVLFNIRPGAPLATRLWAWGPRLKPRAGPPPLFRLTFRDRGAARTSVERVLAWDFDRIVVGHGGIVESDGKRVFAQAWAWVR